jgi:hypothetical protein
MLSYMYLEIYITTSKSISLVGLIFERALFGTGTLIVFLITVSIINK